MDKNKTVPFPRVSDQALKMKMLVTMDETFENCLVEPIKIALFPDNSFVRVNENKAEYLINTDYIITCVL